ncbi:MAG: DNA gyrase inhibitor YacG [Gammaproteobacteria bacterium]|nr:DNA gyrase inhibitor YacG [Gammaproteobacteria bacterium]
MNTVRCPCCRREIEWSAHWPQRPFCSERCRMIDLGAWASEEYRVAGRQIPSPGAADEDPESEPFN